MLGRRNQTKNDDATTCLNEGYSLTQWLIKSACVIPYKTQSHTGEAGKTSMDDPASNEIIHALALLCATDVCVLNLQEIGTNICSLTVQSAVHHQKMIVTKDAS